ncbi:HEAT SHOCK TRANSCRIPTION FACTOR [Salix purpurea]|uniref:HEAT SHOCK TRANSCRIPTION FACTOR n=1 Tax=Salix purpurea TaxID=77065 RepID=A0A9Q0ZHA1_SALPP|nr:HEAT SHOCK TRANSCRIPTION FACTOR [Salix purpurea]
MEAGSSPSSGAGGGPAPFLMKTYEMVDDSSTDEIVSWSSNKNSFVVWNPPEFARLLLPTFFKHNNFSSFIRQLNTYGFRKIDPEKWEFANEDFLKDQKHLLKNIHRRKPIHSHSNPPGSLVDPDRAAYEEEIDKLSRDKAKLKASIVGLSQQRSSAKIQVEDLTQRIDTMQQRQEKLLSFLEKAVQNPAFVEHLACKIESMDFSAYGKKRRLPQADHSMPTAENSFVENHCSSRPESNVIHQDFSNTLRLELSQAVSDINLISRSTLSSNEEGGSPQRKISELNPKDGPTRTSGLHLAPETLELSDTGTSYTFKVNPAVPRDLPASGSQALHSLQANLVSNEEGDGNISCQLNLTLASSAVQVNKNPYLARILGQEIAKPPESRNESNKDSDMRVIQNLNLGNESTTLSCSQEIPNNNQAPASAPARANDVFWEQFLTERPGSSENEEASSNYRANSYDEQDERRLGFGVPRNAKNMEQLSL